MRPNTAGKPALLRLGECESKARQHDHLTPEYIELAGPCAVQNSFVHLLNLTHAVKREDLLQAAIYEIARTIRERPENPHRSQPSPQCRRVVQDQRGQRKQHRHKHWRGR